MKDILSDLKGSLINIKAVIENEITKKKEILENPEERLKDFFEDAKKLIEYQNRSGERKAARKSRIKARQEWLSQQPEEHKKI